MEEEKKNNITLLVVLAPIMGIVLLILSIFELNQAHILRACVELIVSLFINIIAQKKFQSNKNGQTKSINALNAFFIVLSMLTIVISALVLLRALVIGGIVLLFSGMPE